MGLNKTVHILPLPHIKRPVSFDSLTVPRNNGMNVKSLLLCFIVEPVKDSISNLAVFLAGWRCAYPAYTLVPLLPGGAALTRPTIGTVIAG